MRAARAPPRRRHVFCSAPDVSLKAGAASISLGPSLLLEFLKSTGLPATRGSDGVDGAGPSSWRRAVVRRGRALAPSRRPPPTRRPREPTLGLSVECTTSGFPTLGLGPRRGRFARSRRRGDRARNGRWTMCACSSWRTAWWYRIGASRLLRSRPCRGSLCPSKSFVTRTSRPLGGFCCRLMAQRALVEQLVEL